MDSHGVTLYQGADFDRARGLLERALVNRETQFGPDRPAIAASLSTLASILYDQGELDVAHTHPKRAVTIFETPPRPRSPHHRPFDIFDTAIAWSLATLGKALHHQGDLDGARALLERAVAFCEASLGADHPATQRTREDLAAVVTELENR